jgi:hypothetical protein
MYADMEYYIHTYGGMVLSEYNRRMRLEYASECVDILTFGRIKAVGFEALTEFQKNTVLDVCCQLAEWQAENTELVSGAMKSYSINGVSVQYDTNGGAVMRQNGVVLPRMLYNRLMMMGLCYGGVR